MTPTTRPTPMASARPCERPSSTSHCDSRWPERGAGERAREHADQRDADLHGGEEFSGIGGERQRAREPRTPFSTSPASRAGRDETIASSDMERGR
jgi:hypothetical protein